MLQYGGMTYRLTLTTGPKMEAALAKLLKKYNLPDWPVVDARAVLLQAMEFGLQEKFGAQKIESGMGLHLWD